MINFDSLVEGFIINYKKNKKPISVSFREMIPQLNSNDRATHLIHSYPAKLLPHIPHLFINNSILSAQKDKVLDSFCGSGTVLLESLLAGRAPVGADSNPLARLISRTKVRLYDTKVLKDYNDMLFAQIDCRKKGSQPNVVNIDYWFLPRIKRHLGSILYNIENIDDSDYRDFFHVCFSNLIKKVSLADPRVSVPVKLNPKRYPYRHQLRNESKVLLHGLETMNIKNRFNEIVLQNIKRFEKLNLDVKKAISVSLISNDARALLTPTGRKLNAESVQLFISSPPYAGAQKYIRSSSLNLGWLGFTQEESSLRDLELGSIGRENYYKIDYNELKKTNIKNADNLLRKIHKEYPQRAHISANYLIEMADSLKEAARVLKKGGYLILVIGNNQVCGYEFNTQEYLCTIVESLGLEVVFKLIDDIKSYGLMTKRNKTASIITREWILGFKKK